MCSCTPDEKPYQPGDLAWTHPMVPCDCDHQGLEAPFHFNCSAKLPLIAAYTAMWRQADVDGDVKCLKCDYT